MPDKRIGHRRLRVAHVTPGLDMGGLEKLLVEFARHADPARVDMHFVSLGLRGTLAPDVEACGWPVTALNQPSGLRPELVVRLAGLLRQQQIDVVHTHDDRALIYGALAGRLTRVPRVVHTRHGQGIGLSRRQQGLVNLAARLADRFVCVSNDSARLAIRQGVAAGKTAVIWNGVDVGRFAYLGPRPAGPAVLVARMNPEKDVDTLLQAAALAKAACPSFRLEIAGDGPCLPALRQTADNLGLGGNTCFLGVVRDVPALLARAGLFVLSSISEGISLTLLEAMARGLPVVATRVGGNVEVVVDGETGLLVLPRDPAGLARAMLELFIDPERGRRLGAAGRQRVKRYFDVRRMVADYERLYRFPRVGFRHEPSPRAGRNGLKRPTKQASRVAVQL